MLLFHLRSIDPGLSLDRLQSRRKVQLSKDSIDLEHDEHFSLGDEEYLRRLYFTRKDMFDSAVINDDFDDTIIRFMDRFKANGIRSMVGTENKLMILPDRFVDSIILPLKQAI